MAMIACLIGMERLLNSYFFRGPYRIQWFKVWRNGLDAPIGLWSYSLSQFLKQKDPTPWRLRRNSESLRERAEDAESQKTQPTLFPPLARDPCQSLLL